MFNFRTFNIERANSELQQSRRGQLFHVREQLGQGRRGSVFLCDNLDNGSSLPQQVALRFVPRQPSNISSPHLRDEISTHWLLSHHPLVLTFHTAFLTHNFVVIVMEYASGGSLKNYVSSMVNKQSKRGSSRQLKRSEHSYRSSSASMSSPLSCYSRDFTECSDMSCDRVSSPCSESPPCSAPVCHHDGHAAIARLLFQQLITLLEYCHHCGIALGEFHPESFLVSFDTDGSPTLRLSHFGHMHSSHSSQCDKVPDHSEEGLFCGMDLIHWAQTHPRANAAPPSSTSSDNSNLSHRPPSSPRVASCGASADLPESELATSRQLDVRSAAIVLFFMLFGYYPFPPLSSTIRSWRSDSADAIQWPSRSAEDSHVGALIASMLQPVQDNCTLDAVKHHPFFSGTLSHPLDSMTKAALKIQLSSEDQAHVLELVKDLMFASRAPASS